jgi:hypothetical protein
MPYGAEAGHGGSDGDRRRIRGRRQRSSQCAGSACGSVRHRCRKCIGIRGDTQEDAENYIRISGGTITIVNENGNDADGLDSNGDIFITGGDIRISLADNGSNCAIDAATENGGVAEISGGTVIACGSSSMAEGFASSSTQCSILYNISSGTDAGTYLAVKDDAGTEILSWELPCSFSSALVSSPDMQIGETYTVSAGENEETVSLSEISASLGDARSMMAAGNMNRGGMHGRR